MVNGQGQGETMSCKLHAQRLFKLIQTALQVVRLDLLHLMHVQRWYFALRLCPEKTRHTAILVMSTARSLV